MSDGISSSPSTIDPYEYLKIVANPDGTITRKSIAPNTIATPDPVNNAVVLSKDIAINQSSNVWVRIFLPRQVFDSSSSNQKLPLIVYYHGGGFILLSAASSYFHDFCSDMAIELPAVVLSVEYRLAPENRLPAAYDDAMEALHWIKTAQEECLTNYADLSCCFLMGSSAGGNIAYHTGLRAADADVEALTPVKIRGLILHQPFFGGVKRTESELRLINDIIFPACANDLMWELSLPVGADRDHEYCNPTVGSGPKLMGKTKLLGWKVLVTGFYGDPLIDRHIELVKMMKQIGVEVECHFGEGGYHGFEISDRSKAKALNLILKDFVWSTTLAA